MQRVSLYFLAPQTHIWILILTLQRSALRRTLSTTYSIHTRAAIKYLGRQRSLAQNSTQAQMFHVLQVRKNFHLLKNFLNTRNYLRILLGGRREMRATDSTNLLRTHLSLLPHSINSTRAHM